LSAEENAVWRGSGPPPKRLRDADDSLSADAALRAVSEGVGLVWRGDYHQARQLLQALDRRLKKKATPGASAAESFHQLRKQQAERARRLNLILLPFEPGHRLELRRAPGGAAAAAALGEANEPYLLPLREFLGMVGAWEWQQRGIGLPQLPGEQRLHPRWGVFAPTRHEYLDLALQAPLPAPGLTVDVGTGTGVLTILLARRGRAPLMATDTNTAALACAAENFARFGVQAELQAASMFGSARNAMLIVCNPPWLPGKVSSALDAAVYDPDSQMLRAFLAGAAERLAPGGEAWLIISDLAERLGLREPGQLERWITEGGLRVIERLQARPAHGKAFDPDDPLHAARAAEITSLYRLGAAGA
jgi:methylase of polypeptide subunit release factors